MRTTLLTMSDERKNIKVDPETFDALKESKPEGVTWDYYLRELHTRADYE